MKTIKFLLVSLMVMLGTVAFAQDVVIHKTDGTTEVIENADSVVYDVQDYGYYREANTIDSLYSTTGWTKLTSSPQTIAPWSKSKYVAFATPNTNKPVYKVHSAASGGWVTFPVFEGTESGIMTVTINGKSYHYWEANFITAAGDDDKIEITTK